MATYTTKELKAVTGLTATAATLYTVPASTTTTVKTILLSNYTSTDRSVTLHLVPSGGSAAAGNKILGEVTVTANTTTTIDTAIVMPTGAFLSGLASATTSINVHISGVEIS
jgi:ATP-dependent protease ClpP protease subunit